MPDYTAEDFNIESEDAKLLFRFLMEKRRKIRSMKRRLVPVYILAAALGVAIGMFVENAFDLLP